MKQLLKNAACHRLATALFLAYWLLVFGLEVFGWRKPADRPVDMIWPVVTLHLLLGAMAGALVAWWRRSEPGWIPAGMAAGAVVMVIDAAGLLAHQILVSNAGEPRPGGESIFELPVVLLAVALLGSILGLVGVIACAGFTAMHHGFSQLVARSGAGNAWGMNSGAPRRVNWVLCVPMMAAAMIVTVAVIPQMRADPAAGAARATTAFAVNAVLNALLGAAFFAPMPREGAWRVAAVLAACVSLLLGFALLDAAAVLGSQGREGAMAGCFAGAACDLGAGGFALVGAFRHTGKTCDALPSP